MGLAIDTCKTFAPIKWISFWVVQRIYQSNIWKIPIIGLPLTGINKEPNICGLVKKYMAKINKKTGDKIIRNSNERIAISA